MHTEEENKLALDIFFSYIFGQVWNSFKPCTFFSPICFLSYITINHVFNVHFRRPVFGLGWEISLPEDQETGSLAKTQDILYASKWSRWIIHRSTDSDQVSASDTWLCCLDEMHYIKHFMNPGNLRCAWHSVQLLSNVWHTDSQWRGHQKGLFKPKTCRKFGVHVLYWPTCIMDAKMQAFWIIRIPLAGFMHL